MDTLFDTWLGRIRFPEGTFAVSYPVENDRNGGYLVRPPMAEPERWALYVEIGSRAFDRLLDDEKLDALLQDLAQPEGSEEREDAERRVLTLVT